MDECQKIMLSQRNQMEKTAEQTTEFIKCPKQFFIEKRQINCGLEIEEINYKWS